MRLKSTNIEKIISTDREGLATFEDLDDDEYTIIPEVKNDTIFEPTEVVNNNYFTSRIVSIIKDSREEKFYGEYPVFLKVDENLDDLNISLQLDENLVTFPEDINKHMKIVKPLNSINNTKLWWKWRYKYEVYQRVQKNPNFMILSHI